MTKIKLEILGLSSSQSQSGSFALVLGEVGGTRRLPIIIGMFEAQAIAIEIEKITPTRPMTHDLFRSFGNSFHFHVEEIIISDLKEGVFFAQVVATDGLTKSVIDARPSDAIAIGLRFGAGLFTTEQILTEAGITVSEQEAQESDEELPETEEEEEQEPLFPEKKESKPSKSKSADLKSLTVDKLNEHLKEALEQEDYERAARIRDELNKRN
jgi:bifunctional DNase/RNase